MYKVYTNQIKYTERTTLLPQIIALEIVYCSKFDGCIKKHEKA